MLIETNKSENLLKKKRELMTTCESYRETFLSEITAREMCQQQQPEHNDVILAY